MKKLVFFLLSLAALMFMGTSADAQKFKPKFIVFEGAPDYSHEELMAAAGLTPSALLDSSEMKTHAKLLMDCGAFSGLNYTFDGETLKFMLEPMANMYNVRWGNIPFPITDKMLSAIRTKSPLFHGKLPYEGTMLEAAKDVIKYEFAARGVHVEVSTVLYADPDSHGASSITLEVISPAVVVGDLNIEGISPSLAEDLKKLIQGWHGAPFHSLSSGDSMKQTLESFYAGRGYAAAKVNINQATEPVFAATNIQVPFTIQIDEGRLYKLGKINLAAGIEMSPDEMNKAMGLKASEQPNSDNLRRLSVTLTNKYIDQGYMNCKVTPKATLDDVNATVNYDMAVETGPKFYMGDVEFQGFTEDVTGALLANWKLKTGMPFDMHYVTTYIMQLLSKNPTIAKQMNGGRLNYSLNTDAKTHIVSVTFKREH
jgi:outer membrane protein insertion porin family